MKLICKLALALSIFSFCVPGTCSNDVDGIDQQALQELQKRFATQATSHDLSHALMEQAYYGRPKSFAWLLQRGADCNLRAENGANVLIFAADNKRPKISQPVEIDGAKEVPWKGEEEVLRARDQTFDLALACSAEVNALDHGGRSALHYAAKNKRWDAVAKLIAKGGDINLPDRDGATVLLKASAADWPLLVKHGANINAADLRGRTVLHEAFNRPTFKALQEQVNVAIALGARDSQDKQGKFASEMNAGYGTTFEGDFSGFLIRMEAVRALIRKSRQ